MQQKNRERYRAEMQQIYGVVTGATGRSGLRTNGSEDIYRGKPDDDEERTIA